MEIYDVSQVTSHLKDVIESDPALGDLWVSGEISNFILAQSGHAYFTLKDYRASLRCVLFRGQINRRTILPQNGQSVIAHGRISVYEPQGTYQLYVDLVQPEGMGLLHLQFEELRSRLEREGLFDLARKRPLPRFPRTVGVVTSPSGAVIRDIINVISRRFPAINLVIAPTPVQGEDAVDRIVDALRLLNEEIAPDVIVIARGGGSIEDLWCFNDERVARAIFASRSPVVSAIGHETDYTIADWVADVRAPTPSAAAELIVPDTEECLLHVEALRARLQVAVNGRIESQRNEIDDFTHRLERQSPLGMINRHRMAIDDLAARAADRVRHRVELARVRVDSCARQANALNPLAVLDRGYSLCRADSGEVVRRLTQVSPGQHVTIRVSDGSFDGTVGAEIVNLDESTRA